LQCRVCGRETQSVVDFGPMPIANNFVKKAEDDSYRFNLAASFCQICHLLQIDEQPLRELMFHEEYKFFTGLSEHMRFHFRDMFEEYFKTIVVDSEAVFIVEIGCNDGTLLEAAKNRGLRHLGIDPSANVVKRANERGISTKLAFFDSTVAANIKNEIQKADLIFAANVVCHIPDLLDVVSGIKILLSENGKFIFEEPYVGSMIEKTSYDQIYDEHVYIFGVLAIQKVFSSVGLELIDAIPQSTHGGSMRYVIAHRGQYQVSNNVNRLIKEELKLGYDQIETYKKFGSNCESRKIELINLLKRLNSEGYKVAGYAATSKSTTILNYCNIDSNLISYISDSTTDKQGTFSPGMYIPVVSHETMRANPPDYLVLFAWNHEIEILQKESVLTSQGIKWIRFVPEVEVMSFHEI
jgi:methylation protein EvaC